MVTRNPTAPKAPLQVETLKHANVHAMQADFADKVAETFKQMIHSRTTA